MHNKYSINILIFMIALLCANCSYIQEHQQATQYSHIENKITLSTLDNVNEYTSQTPFHKTYEFEFENTKNQPYALIFYISESSFSKSMLKHRHANDLHRNAIRIDGSKNILSALNTNLPKANTISWQQVSHQITEIEARDGYHVMQEFIRLKIRDL